MHSDEIIPLSIKRLLSDEKYLIPIYQRNYDWGEKESLQLIQDIADFASTKKGKKYYIGSLVVFVRSKEGQEYFETIDGELPEEFLYHGKYKEVNGVAIPD